MRAHRITTRGPGGHDRQAATQTRSRSSAGIVQDDMGCMNLNFMSAGSRPACRDGQARAPPRPRTLSARLARQQPHRAVAVGLASLLTDQHVLARGCSRVNECRGSAEAKLHTEHGSGLLNDNGNWLRSAPPEPDGANEEHNDILFFALTVTETCSREQEKRPVAANLLDKQGGVTTKSTCSGRPPQRSCCSGGVRAVSAT